MNMLIDGAPGTVEIDGKEYAVNTDFRVFLLMEEMLLSNEIPEADKPFYALSYFYDSMPDNLDVAIDKMLWFYRCGDESYKDEKKKDGGADSKDTPYSIEQDFMYIYASFWKEYHIDLSTDDLHWWKYKALFQCLVSGIDFPEVVKCREVKITKAMSKAEKEYYKCMKKVHKIKSKALPAPDNFDDFKKRIIEKSNKSEKRAREALLNNMTSV